ncbi:putative outer membrane protein [hydrothermal vent metagenome]|uniref:Putative outer membrane protein n=1 Tax=hydrothermal vent metagenome TaxID=652676 RepID=A0A1W1EDZ8_9ZZZZ
MGKIKTMSKAGLSLCAVMVLSGCTPLGPDFMGVGKPPIPQKWIKNGKKDNKAIAQWWKTFNDPTLNLLIQKTYAQNLDIKSAGLRIAQARSALGISQGLAFPQAQSISGVATSTHTKAADIASANLKFDMGWELDIWGKYARGTEASEANLYASISSYNDIMVSVISEVARNYINYRTAQERLAYGMRNVKIQERVTRMTEIQFNSGNVSELDMQQSRSQLYNTRSVIPSIEILKAKARNALAVLLNTNEESINRILNSNSNRYKDTAGKYIASDKKGILQIKESKSDLLNINIIPTARLNPYNKIDANLITQRPDIKIAEYKVRSNNALIGATIAELYPSFSLFGNIGYNSSNTPSATNPTGSWIAGSDALGVTIGPSFSWNIFQYGRIKNQIRLKDAIFEESLVNYNSKVLKAVREVSDALNGYIYTQKQQVENKKAVDATIRAFNISVVQYNDGLVSYQRLLTTVEKLTSTQDRYASIKGNLAIQAVLLYKALGGGWQMSRGHSYISAETAAKMKGRVDWDRYLDPEMTRLPEGIQK